MAFKPGTVQMFIEKQPFAYSLEDKKRLRSFRIIMARHFKTPFYKLDKNFREKIIDTLIFKYSKYFDIWWNESLLDILYTEVKYDALCKLFTSLRSYDKYWFDISKMNLKMHITLLIRFFDLRVGGYMNKIDYNNIDFIYNLISYQSPHFNLWWDRISPSTKEKLYIKYTYLLCIHCENYFDKWFDKDKINWNHLSDLIIYCPNHFDKWFDKDKISDSTLTKYFRSLIKYIPEKFDVWFDKKIFDYERLSVHLILKFYDKFDMWWDKKKFNYTQQIKDRYDLHTFMSHNTKPHLKVYNYFNARDLLIFQYSERDKFKSWWSKIHFRPNKKLFNLLQLHSAEMKKEWGPSYIRFELLN